MVEYEIFLHNPDPPIVVEAPILNTEQPEGQKYKEQLWNIVCNVI